MAEFITLTKEEADKLRGITSPGHALDPIELEDGATFILPLEVLSDPAHAKFLGDRKADVVKPVDILDSRKKRVVLPKEFKKQPDIDLKETTVIKPLGLFTPNPESKWSNTGISLLVTAP